MTTPSVPLSVLDLSPVPEGGTAAGALRATIALAAEAERWGYKRYWVAEHHFAAVASSSPATLVGLIAAATNTIRVGSAAVQIGFASPAAAVEAFGTIDALYPGRLDLGLGRSLQRRSETMRAAQRDSAAPSGGSGSGSSSDAPPAQREVPADQDVQGLLVPAPFPIHSAVPPAKFAATADALIFRDAQIPDFADAVADIVAMLGDTYSVPGIDGNPVPLTVTPGAGADIDVFVLGSSAGQSARVAGRLGLPFVAAYHIIPSTALDAVQAYREAFRPSATLSEPHVIVSADVVVADDDDKARHLASTFGHWVHAIRSGLGAQPYPDPATTPALTDEQYEVVQDRIRTQFVGAPDTVAEGLRTLAQASGADELVVTSMTYDGGDRLRSYELLAREWGLTG